MNSRAKGAVGERELAQYLKERGIEARRGQQFHGGADSPDVVADGLPGIHIECKRVESGNLHDWLDQAIRDAGVHRTPVVMHRRNPVMGRTERGHLKRDESTCRGRWTAVMLLDDFLALVQELQSYKDVML